MADFRICTNYKVVHVGNPCLSSWNWKKWRPWFRLCVVTFLSFTSASVSLEIESAPLHHIHCLHSLRCRLVATWWMANIRSFCFIIAFHCWRLAMADTATSSFLLNSRLRCSMSFMLLSHSGSTFPFVFQAISSISHLVAEISLES